MAVKECYAGKINRKLAKKLRFIAVAAGREKAVTARAGICIRRAGMAERGGAQPGTPAHALIACRTAGPRRF